MRVIVPEYCPGRKPAWFTSTVNEAGVVPTGGTDNQFPVDVAKAVKFTAPPEGLVTTRVWDGSAPAPDSPTKVRVELLTMREPPAPVGAPMLKYTSIT
jgi:hypothetical protein